MMWCDQLRVQIARALLEIVDVRNAGQVRSRAERMQSFRSHFLSGFRDERYGPNFRHLGSKRTLVLASTRHAWVPVGSQLTLRAIDIGADVTHLLPIPRTNRATFSLLTDVNANAPIEVHACSSRPSDSLHPQSGSFSFEASAQEDSRSPAAVDPDESGHVQNRFTCYSLAPNMVKVPRSATNGRPTSNQDPLITFLEVDLSDLAEFQTISVHLGNAASDLTFLVAQFVSHEIALQTSPLTLSGTSCLLCWSLDSYRRLWSFILVVEGLLFPSQNHELTVQPAIASEVRLPLLDSSLLAFKLERRHRQCDGADSFPCALMSKGC